MLVTRLASWKGRKALHKKTFERLRQEVFDAVDEKEEAYRQAVCVCREVEKTKPKGRKMPGWEKYQCKLAYLT